MSDQAPTTEASHDAVADGVTDPPAPLAQPVVDRGECPLCGIEFDDPEVFRDHLGSTHGLYDDDGATTMLPPPALPVVVEEAGEPEPIFPVPAPPPTPAKQKRQKLPVGVVIFIAFVVFGT